MELNGIKYRGDQKKKTKKCGVRIGKKIKDKKKRIN